MLLLGAGAAQAAAVTNLDGQPRIVEVDSAEGFQPATIAPHETWRVPGKVKIRYQGTVRILQEVDEYAIWQGGALGPQRRITGGRGTLE